MNRRCDAASRCIEVEGTNKLHCDLLPDSKRLVRIGKCHKHLISIFKMHMVLISEVFDAVHAADKSCPIHLSELHVLGTDTNRTRAGWNRHFGNPLRGNELDRRDPELAGNIAVDRFLVDVPRAATCHSRAGCLCQ